MRLTRKPSLDLFFSLLIVLGSSSFPVCQEATTEEPQTVNVWPADKMPGKGAKDPESLRSPERTDAIRITNVSRPTLSLFLMKDTKEPAPAMIVCPGGGYNYVVVDKEGSEIAQWLNSIGINALVLKYRVPSNREGAFQDLQRSIRLVRNNAAKWNLDPKQIGVVGFSAGGHLSARASTEFEKPAYESVDDIDKQSCRPDFALLVYPAYLERLKLLSNESNEKLEIPPTLIVHSEDDDRFITGSKLYAAALNKMAMSHKFLLYPTGGHGYGLRSERDARVWPTDAAEWLRANNIR